MLVALITAQRLQTLQALDIGNMYLKPNEAVFLIPNLLNQSRPGKKQLQVVLPSHRQDQTIDVYQLLMRYIEVTKIIRGTVTQLFITYARPHRPASRENCHAGYVKS